MTNRYTVTELPGPLLGVSKATQHYAVVDTRPECEVVENFIGKMVLESRRPQWRQIAYCTQLQHAEGLADAMNKTEEQRHGAQRTGT